MENLYDRGSGEAAPIHLREYRAHIKAGTRGFRKKIRGRIRAGAARLRSPVGTRRFQDVDLPALLLWLTSRA